MEQYSIELPLRPYLKRFLLYKTKSTNPIEITKKDPIGFGILVTNCLISKRDHFLSNSSFELKRYSDSITLLVGTSIANRRGLFLNAEKIHDINAFLFRAMYNEIHSFINGAHIYHSRLVEKFALEDLMSMWGITEDDISVDSLYKEFSRKRAEYTIVN